MNMMAAPIRHSVTYLVRCINVGSTNAKIVRNVYRCICSAAEKTSSSIVTKETTVDKAVAQELEHEHIGKSGRIRYRTHPGVMIEQHSQLPPRLVKAVQILFEKYPVGTLLSSVDKLVRYLQQRSPPITNRELAEKTREIESKILEKDKNKLEDLTGEELESALENLRKKVVNRLRQTTYHWKPMQYDAVTTYVYLIGRLASDYSVLLQTFTEISKRDTDFKPTSIFHHGSKVGSSIWAADKIWKTVGEHYCVEESGHMNTIAQLLLQDGNEQQRVSSIKGVYFRQFIPSPKEHKFSMVVSSYMLMEQPSASDRLQLVRDLWEMAETYLVLVENGTGAGFSLINEAKEFLLKEFQESSQLVVPGHVFAPCPHDKSCPKLRVKNQPCLTESILRNLDMASTTLREEPKKHARYSYVILKKGPRVKDTEWPRVLHPIKAERHVHVHLCLPYGELQHVVITKGRFEKHLYGCAKYLDQGDRLPVSLSFQPSNPNLEIRESLFSKEENGDPEVCVDLDANINNLEITESSISKEENSDPEISVDEDTDVNLGRK